MRPGVAGDRWVPVLIASILMLLAGPAASAWADAKVRFVHAIPGSGPASLTATQGGIDQKIDGPVGFGEIGSYANVPAGQVTFELGDLAEAKAKLRNRAYYTVVAMRQGSERLMVLSEGRGDGGEARLRAVNAAGELGQVDVQLGDTPVADSVGVGEVTSYKAVEPGAYAVQVTSPKDGSMIASAGGVTLTAGTSSTAFVIGTGGEPVQTIVAADRTATPRGAPATGLGGLADEDSHLLLALLAALLAALAGAVIYVALTARWRRGGT
jgi:Domain of unknown function (DUF4397)